MRQPYAVRTCPVAGFASVEGGLVATLAHAVIVRDLKSPAGALERGHRTVATLKLLEHASLGTKILTSPRIRRR